jgi:sulfatase maturation enzyme AslB (radical SAM superfamily)
MNLKILAAVLARANSCPPMNFRQEFYAIKQHILKMFGRIVGEDIQRIERRCWNYYCDDDCDRCGGTGIYSCSYYRLERWELSGRIFHRPAERILSKPVHWNIDGKIEHKRWLNAKKCAAALFILFAPRFVNFQIGEEGVNNFRASIRIVAAIGMIPESHLLPF